MFSDTARIYVEGGDGGNGVVAFRREKFVPRGGPNGGNGGKGGDVYLIVDGGMNTLYSLQNHVHHRAERGAHGSGTNKTGANGDDLYVAVPPGTLVFDAETHDLITDLTEPGQTYLVAAGGRGGRGNAAFKTARNNAPRIAENGEQGVERWLELELKLVADVGIIGVPNAGKSTLLSVISAAKPKIADYPFTTVAPNLGVADVGQQQIVFADVPGLLEGAHEGVGLGIDFLRHIERTRMLVHVIAGNSPDPLGDFEAINQELNLFNPALTGRPQIVALNKMDLPESQEVWPSFKEAIEAQGYPVISISAATTQNVQDLLYRVQKMLNSLPAEEPSSVEEEVLPEIVPQGDENEFRIYPAGDHEWRVEGVAIERIAQMTNWDYYEAGLRFQRILRAMGIVEALREEGVEEGDTVHIGAIELVWGYENAFEE